jgi:hypothetical protein
LRRLFTLPLVLACQRKLGYGQSPAKVARWLVEQPGAEIVKNLAHNTLRQYLGVRRREVKRALVVRALLQPDRTMAEVQEEVYQAIAEKVPVMLPFARQGAVTVWVRTYLVACQIDEEQRLYLWGVMQYAWEELMRYREFHAAPDGPGKRVSGYALGYRRRHESRLRSLATLNWAGFLTLILELPALLESGREGQPTNASGTIRTTTRKARVN